MNKRTVTSMILAFLIPGLGHFFLGRRARAIGFFSVIVLLFVIGLAIDGGLYTLGESRGSLLKTLASVGSMGSGALYYFATLQGPHGNVTALTYEYGTTFTLTAGLMNLLLVLDCFDISTGRKK